MSFYDCDDADIAAALRLVLSFLDGNSEAYRATMAEHGAPERLVNALAGFAAGIVIADVRADWLERPGHG